MTGYLNRNLIILEWINNAVTWYLPLLQEVPKYLLLKQRLETFLVSRHYAAGIVFVTSFFLIPQHSKSTSVCVS